MFYEVIATDEDSAQRAIALLNFHVSHQMELADIRARNEALESDFEAARAEFREGKRVEFEIPHDMVGVVIGKKGANVNRVQEETGVDRIIVDSELSPPVVRIRGASAAAVAHARRLLEYVVERVPLSRSQMAWVIGSGGDTLNSIKISSKVRQRSALHPLPRVHAPTTRLSPQITSIDVEDAVSDGASGCIIIKGVKTAVATAKIMISTQLEYQSDFEK